MYLSIDDGAEPAGMHLLRTGFPDEGEETMLIDALKLSYDGNQLISVTDN